jgi:hypothetical protein
MSLFITLFRWDAACDWKDTNPKGTMKEFHQFWNVVQKAVQKDGQSQKGGKHG